MIPGQNFARTFQIKYPRTGLKNADALPTAQVYVNGILTAIAPTVTNQSVGVYNYSFLVPTSGQWVPGAQVDIHITSVVDSIPVLSKKSVEVTANTSTLETDVAAIKVKTDKLPADTAVELSNIFSAGS